MIILQEMLRIRGQLEMIMLVVLVVVMMRSMMRERRQLPRQPIPSALQLV